MRKLVLILASGVGSGYFPFAPGTWGALVGLALYAGLVQAPLGVLLAFVVLLAALGVWAAGRAEQLYGRADDSRITIDEVVGMLVSLVWLPVRLDVALAAFGLFRLFDIVKPFPIRRAEALGGGVGVMADDLVAGVYANLLGQVLWRYVFPEGLW